MKKADNSGIVGGAYRQVVSEKLHNQGAVLVRLLVESIELSNGIIESLFGKVAGSLGRVKNLVVEHREVQS